MRRTGSKRPRALREVVSAGLSLAMVAGTVPALALEEASAEL